MCSSHQLNRHNQLRILCGAIALLLSIVVASFYPVTVGAADKKIKGNVRDLFFGEALFYAEQNNHFAAVTRLDAELAQHYSLDDPKSDSLSYHKEESELLVADIELSYRMHRKVGRAMQRLLDHSVHRSIRDRAAYRLARVAYTKSSYGAALENLQQISSAAPRKLQLQAALLRGQCLIALGRHKEAVAALQPVYNEPALAGFAPYNYGIALIGSGEIVSGFRLLDKVGVQTSQDRVQGALRDKANLILGFTLLNARKAAKARTYFERVQLQGPFSNKALLWVGWSDAAQNDYEQALVPWMMLRKRDISDSAVQEAMLAAPYGFGQLKAYGRSAVLYGEAVNKFNHAIDRIDDSVRSIREGKLLQAMLRDEARTNEQWLFALRKLPGAPETRYMRELMAGHAFNESYRNFRDLHDLGDNIDHWRAEIPAYRDLLRVRRNYYAPLLPDIEHTWQRFDRRLGKIATRHTEIASKIKILLRKRDPMALATAKEKRMLRQLKRIQSQILRVGDQKGVRMLREKHQRLTGLLHWQINTKYENRLSLAHQHLRQLGQAIGNTRKTLTMLARTKSEAALSYQGYNRALTDLEARLDYLKIKITGLKSHQGQYMERRAISELHRRKQRLQRYRTKARFALAESYDYALRSQKNKELEKTESSERRK
ncbi:MAG: tetratricopeptide repeat protein [Acidiferrobacterales bacterium]